LLFGYCVRESTELKEAATRSGGRQLRLARSGGAGVPIATTAVVEFYSHVLTGDASKSGSDLAQTAG